MLAVVAVQAHQNIQVVVVEAQVLLDCPQNQVPLVALVVRVLHQPFLEQ
jgi:hypothetical protein